MFMSGSGTKENPRKTEAENRQAEMRQRLMARIVMDGSCVIFGTSKTLVISVTFMICLAFMTYMTLMCHKWHM